MKRLLAAILTLTMSTAWAWQPTKPVNVVIGFAPGSGNEVSFRGVAAIVERNNPGVTFVVENRPGADAALAMNHFIGLPSNGYHINIASQQNTWVMGEVINRDIVRWTPDSFEYAINIAKSPLAIIAHKDSPVNTPQELIKLLETTNRNINFAVGSSSHKLAFEYLINNTKARKHQILTANYKGPNQAGQDVAGGHVEFGIIPAAIAYQFYKADKVKIIGLCGEKRLELIPNVPLMDKYVPGLNVYAGWGILLPKNTPKEIVEWYNREFKKAITSAQAKEFFKQNLMFVEERELTPDGYYSSMLVLRHRWQPIARSMDFGNTR
jgi:tripartite-type tricarboxylate transporter receptor subunit TctC